MHLALIEENVPVVALAAGGLFDKMVSNIQEVNARGASVLAGHEGLRKWKVAKSVVYIPKTHPLLAPVLTVIPLAVGLLHGRSQGRDVDA